MQRQLPQMSPGTRPNAGVAGLGPRLLTTRSAAGSNFATPTAVPVTPIQCPRSHHVTMKNVVESAVIAAMVSVQLACVAIVALMLP